ncbi:glutamine-synthetase adenylyltransferase, partial [Stenotrophomonas geniculata]
MEWLFTGGLTHTRRFCFAVQRAKCFRSPHDGPASRRGGGSRARWQFAASGLFYCLSSSMNTRHPFRVGSFCQGQKALTPPAASSGGISGAEPFAVGKGIRPRENQGMTLAPAELSAALQPVVDRALTRLAQVLPEPVPAE